ncbi:MAG TPA: ABC transporter permease [Gemmatimonadaceae bacterium]|nr:ABC transporter permease [Gemmatimonadaceae bacterium]
MRAAIRDGVRRLLRLPSRTARQIRDEVDEELDGYLGARIEQLVSRGMTPDEARREAVRRLGGSLERVRAELRHSATRRERHLAVRERVEEGIQDVRYALRGLARQTGFTATVSLTLAVGIGATTSIFSALNALLLRPLPYARADELMKVTLVTPGRGAVHGSDEMVWSYPKYAVFRDGQRAFTDVSAYAPNDFTLTSGEVERIHGETITSHYLPVLGVRAELGGNFASDIDAHGDARREALISDVLWKRRFNADPRIVGQIIDIDRQPFTIAGVTPEGFAGLSGQAEVFVPITTRSAEDLNQAFDHEYSVVTRRRPDISAGQARAMTALVGQEVDRRFPDLEIGKAWSAKAEPLDHARVTSRIRRSLWVLMGAVALVLLVACVNIANLVLARASSRGREMAVRLALGAGRARLVRLLLTESMVLAALGGALSLVVSWIGIRLLSRVDPTAIGGVGRSRSYGLVTVNSIHLDIAALVFTLGAAIVVGVLFGLAPALHATRASVAETLKDGGVSTIQFGRRLSARGLLVMTEVALAFVLLVGSGLMIRSVANLLSVPIGADPRNVLTVRLTAPPGTVPRDSLPGLYENILRRLAALPGATRVALGDCPPLNDGCNRTFAARGNETRGPDRSPLVGIHWVSARWFETLHVPVVRGRVFTDADRVGAPKVIIISVSTARKLFPGENPIGQRLSVGQGGFSGGADIVGVVGDVRQSMDSTPMLDTYIPFAQSPRSGMMIFIRTAGDPAALAAPVRSALREIAPRFPVYDLKTLSARTAAISAPARFSTTLLGLFAAVGLSLAAIGIYGVMSLMVTERRRELGIRMALGADQSAVRRMVVRQAARLAAAGALIGLIGAFSLSRVMRALLFEVTAFDPATYLVILFILCAAALAASWIPARRATLVSPMEALRQG